MTDRWGRWPRARESEDSRLEDLLRKDFAIECQRTTTDLDLDQLAVERAMFRARRIERAPRPWRTPAQRRSFVALAVAAVFVGGVAAAVFGSRPALSERAPLALAPPSPNPSPPPARPDKRVPEVDSPDRPDRGVQAVQPNPTIPSLKPSTEAAPPAAGVRAQSTAATLFERANRLRRQGQTVAALRGYNALQARYPSARESRLSHAICGRLYLQLSQPNQALQQFSLYLTGGGAATQDALAGRADAYRQLGDSGRERAAWRRLLRDYPKSVHAQRARSRLKVLE